MNAITIKTNEVQALKQLFDQCRNVVITCHTSPDGDAIGSSLALYEYLTRRGKSVKVIVPNYFPDFLKWMHDADKIMQFDRHRSACIALMNHADLICCLDYNDPSRLDPDMQKALDYTTGKRLLIDHHLHPARFCDVVVSRPEASSTCELLYKVIQAIGGLKDFNKYAAEDIYAGMCTDTGRFSYNSNTPDIFLIISQLIAKGIDKDRVIRNLYNQQNEGRYRLMGYILNEKLELFPEYHAALYAIDRNELSRFNFMKGDTESIVNIPLEIRDIDLSISLREDTEKQIVYVSLRSVDDIAVNEMAARYFNGGGHKNASGGRLYCTVPEAVEIARKAIAEFMSANNSETNTNK